MKSTMKDSTARRVHDGTHNQPRRHLGDFMAAQDVARGPKPPGGRTPCEYICKLRASEADRSTLNPIHQMPGLNT